MILSRRRALRLAAAALPALVLARPVPAASAEVFAVGGLAIRGADPVGYFREGGPVAGDPLHGLMWRGATWQFASAANRDAFEMDPGRYAPRFGGYCAYALSLGQIATTVPEAWTIHEDRLYLNYSLPVRSLWAEDIPGNVARAEGHWPDALGA